MKSSAQAKPERAQQVRLGLLRGLRVRQQSLAPTSCRSAGILKNTNGNLSKVSLNCNASKTPPKVPSVVHRQTLGQRIHGSRREIRVIVIPERLGIMAVPWKTGCRTRTQARVSPEVRDEFAEATVELQLVARLRVHTWLAPADAEHRSALGAQ